MNIVERIRSVVMNPPGRMIRETTRDQVIRTLQKTAPTLDDLPALLSEAAADELEALAQCAAEATRKRFGNVIFLFTPLYISNYCENACPYCSFSVHHAISRKHLDRAQIERECRRIAESGIRHILVLTGESRRKAPVDYLAESIETIAAHFSSIGIEVYPLSAPEYGRLIDCGVDSLTIYQETYNEQLYRRLHVSGPKADYAWRLAAPDRACEARMRGVTIGALLGLDSVRQEAFALGTHLDYLQKRYPDVELGVSFPRMRPLSGDFETPYPVDDRTLAQLICAFRIVFPAVGITLSTRENQTFRDGALPLGVTRMSAGVSTAVGGHSGDPSTTQFEIADTRSVTQVQRDLRARGFQPVMHDWNKKLFQADPLLR